MLSIKIINQSTNPNPTYATPLSAGMDLRAFITEPVELNSLERKLIQTGIFLELPAGFEAQIRPRSGLAIHSGITLLNSPGTIDADYRGEIQIIVINFSSQKFIIQSGDKIAQMIISKHETIEWENVEILSTTKRNEGGFGSTGI